MTIATLDILPDIIEESVVDLRIPGTKTLANFYENNRIVSTQQTIHKWNIIHDDPNAETGTADMLDEDLEETGGSTSTQAAITIGRYKLYEKFSFNRVATVEARQYGREALTDLVESTVQDRLKKLLKKMNKLIWLGDGSKASAGVIGLQKVMDNTYNYADVDRTLYPQWRCPTLDAASPRALTRDLTLELEEHINNNDLLWNYACCNPTIGVKYTKVFDQLAGTQALALNSEEGGFRRADLGHGSRAWQGAPIVEDGNQPTGDFLLMDMSQITLMTFDLSTNINANLEDEGFNPNDYEQIAGANVMGLNIHIAKLPSPSSTIQKFEMFILPQLRVRNPQAITGLRKLT